jgi:uncharacterized OB-fold protein
MVNLTKEIMFKLYEIEGTTMIFQHINLLEGRMKEDYVKRNKNITEGKELCQECGGTGNLLFEDYLICENCGGKGFVESN